MPWNIEPSKGHIPLGHTAPWDIASPLNKNSILGHRRLTENRSFDCKQPMPRSSTKEINQIVT